MAVKDSTPSIILQDNFYLYPSLSIPCVLCLTDKVLFVKNNSKIAQLQDIPISDIIGCHMMQAKTDRYKSENNDISSYLCVYAYPLRSAGLLSKQARRERYATVFQMKKCGRREENLSIVRKWRIAILWLLKGKQLISDGEINIPAAPPLRKRLLILVNPHSGPGKASQIFKERVIPLLEESDIEYKLMITDRANYARDLMKKVILNEWSGIVVVSGDGLLFEVFNGLMERADWETAIKMPVGVIPGGSGNGLARAISYANGEPYDTNAVTSSTLNIVHGRVTPMDIVQVQTTGDPVYSFLSIGWGLMADIDIESEKFRAIGEARFTLWAVIRALGLRKYKGRLSFLPVESHKTSKKNNSSMRPDDITRSKTLENKLMWSSTNSKNTAEEDFSRELFRSKSLGAHTSDACASNDDKVVKLMKFTYSGEFPKSEEYGKQKQSLKLRELSDTQDSSETTLSCYTNDSEDDPDYLSASEDFCLGSDGYTTDEKESNSANRHVFKYSNLDQPVPSDWIVVEDDFVLVYVSHQTHLSSDVLFAPEAKLDDGIMWLIVIRAGVSRTQVIYFLSSLHTGDHVNIPYVEVIPIHAFRLEPAQTDGFLTVDGEVIPCGSIQAEVLPSVARVMAR